MVIGCGAAGGSGSTPDGSSSPGLGTMQTPEDSGMPQSTDGGPSGSVTADATNGAISESGAPRPEDASADHGTNAPSCPATSSLQHGDSSGTLQWGGQARTYVLHVPPGYTGQSPVPLVLDFHYILGTAQGEENVSGYASLADQEGFLVAFPQGIDDAWNIGPCCTTSRTVDDVGFARALVTQLKGQACIDPKRVYAVGFSMGGGMSDYLACNAADVFAAVAPSSFDLLTASEEPCTPSRPITEISFRGTADPVVPYAGGASMPPNGLNVTIHFLGAVGTFQRWAQIDQCTGSPSAADSNGCQTYSQCGQGAEVTLCTIQGGGHSPGSAQQGWAMLKKHPMP
jgi:polyhydroxybutyrate depolymerase